MTESQGPRKAALAFVFVTVALDMLALGMIIPVLPSLILDFTGGDEAHAAAMTGLFGTLWAAMQFLASPVLGALSDTLGRRRIILISNFGLGLDYLLMALAPNMTWLFVGRVLSGITAASISTSFAYIADITAPEKRAQSFGMLGAAFGLGFVIGPALGGVLGALGPRVPFWAACTLSLLNGCYGLFVLPESLPKDKRAPFSFARANPLGSLLFLRSKTGVLGLSFLAFLSNTAHHVLPATFVLYAMHRYGWGTRDVGLMLGAVGVSSSVVQAVLVRRVVPMFGERRTLIAAYGFGALGFSLYGFAPVGWMLVLAIPVTALWGLAGPAGQALMSKRVEATEQGQLQGVQSSLQGISGMVGPFIFASVFAHFISGPPESQIPGAAFYLAGLMLACNAVFAVLATRDFKSAPVQPTPA